MRMKGVRILMNKDKYLPIGSVVLLDNATKRLMVIGHNTMNNGKRYDYYACMFPEGLGKLDKKLVFNHSQIKLIYHIGFGTYDEESKKYHEKLNNKS